MSGMAGASKSGRYCSVFYNSGMYVSIEPPPGVDPHQYIDECFKKDDAKYAETLDVVFDELCQVFERAILEQSLPIVEFGDAQWTDGVIDEDVLNPQQSSAQLERNERLAAAGEPVIKNERTFVQLEFPVDGGAVECRFVIKDRIKRSELSKIERQMKEVFRRQAASARP